MKATYILMIVCMMLATSVVFLQATGYESGPSRISDPSRNTDTIPLEQGSRLYVHNEMKTLNDSYHIPIPRGAKVLSTKLSLSPVHHPSEPASYPIDPWIRIGTKNNDMDFPSILESDMTYHLGAWGRQTRGSLGQNFAIFDAGTASPFIFETILPVGAEMEHMSLDLIGYQRSDEYITYNVEGDTDGDRMGAVLINAGKIKSTTADTLITGAPDGDLNYGVLYRVHYSSGSFIKEVMANGPEEFAYYSTSISDTFKVTSSIDYIVVGAPGGGKDQEGAVHLYNVRNSYGTNTEDTLLGNTTLESFGASVAVGDIDDDGWKEIIVGAPDANSGSGKVYILKYDATNPDFSDKTRLINVIEPDSTSEFGRFVSSGDMNDDGIDDIAIASEDAVHIYFGSSSFNTIQDLEIDPVSDGSLSGFSFMGFIKDTLGSGSDTLAIGASANSDRKVLIYDASDPPDAVLDQMISAPLINGFGSYVSSSYDIDDDGDLEFAIGAPDPGTGSQIVLYSRSQGQKDILYDSRNGAMFGSSIVIDADLRGDGYKDICSGAVFKDGITSKGIGNIVINDRFDIDTLPFNTPSIWIGSNLIWSYNGDRLNDKVNSGDISDVVSDYIKNIEPDPELSTSYHNYIRLPLRFSCSTSDPIERSTIFNLSSLDIRYDHQVAVDDVSEKINSELRSLEVQLDGNHHVPFRFFSKAPGGIVINEFDIDLDLPPVFSGYPKALSLEEDTCDPKLLDLYAYLSDDLTPIEDLTIEVFPGLINTSFVNFSLVGGRYLKADAFNDTSSTESNDNWTGLVYPLIRITDSSGLQIMITDIVVEVTPVNDAPALKTLPQTDILQDTRWIFSPTFYDAEGDNATFTYNELPGMFLQNNRTLVWDVNNSHVGLHPLIIKVTDGMDSRTYRFVLNVINKNDPPYFISLPPEYIEVHVGDIYEFNITAEDIDPDDRLEYLLVEGESAVLDPLSGEFTFTASRFYPEPILFKISVTDRDEEEILYTFRIRVIQRFLPPEVHTTPRTELFDMMPWSYEIIVTDPQGDIPAITLLFGPNGMEFDPFRNLLAWTPDVDQIGDHNVSIQVNSSGYSLLYNFTLSVSRSIRSWNVMLSSPDNGEKVVGTLKITGVVLVEPGYARLVQLKARDGSWINTTLLENTFSFDVDTNRYKDGERVFEMRAFDGYEYHEFTASVVIANHEGEWPIWAYLLVVIFVILVLAGLGYAGYLGYGFYKRKEEKRIKREKLAEIQKSKQDMDEFLVQNISSPSLDDVPIKPGEVEAMDLDDLVRKTDSVIKDDDGISTMSISKGVFELSEEISPHNEDGAPETADDDISE
ncbi:MAG: FG-GAP repeat protein [Candidatus Thermoplasmatota archaeon]|nr:FG-GAP repeat protein [Candidatus Thermoplasmatota archaeon]